MSSLRKRWNGAASCDEDAECIFFRAIAFHAQRLIDAIDGLKSNGRKSKEG